MVASPPHTVAVTPERRDVSVWLQHPLGTVTTATFAGGVWVVIVFTTDWMASHQGLYLAAGLAIAPAFAWLWNWPERLTFDGDRFIRARPLRQDQVLPIREISGVEGGYEVKVGPKVYVMGSDPRQTVALWLGSDDHKLMLRRLGRRLEELDMTRVITNEDTRRAVGIPGGGLRDPWTPKRTIEDCPSCGHDWREHAASGVDAAIDGACGECVYELRGKSRRDRASACRCLAASWEDL